MPAWELPLKKGSLASSMQLGDDSLDPICDEDIGIAGLAAVAVGGKNQVLAVGGEHGEAVEAVLVGHPLLTGAVRVHQVQIEFAAAGVGMVAAEDDSFAVGMEEGREIGSAVVSDLALVAAVGVHDEQFQSRGTDQVFAQQCAVVLDLFGIGPV